MSMKEKYSDEEKLRGKCYDCTIPYSDFVDLSIPDKFWEMINPTFHEGAGLLCPNCITKRLKKIKAGDVSCIIHT